MAKEIKTKKTDASVSKFIDMVADEGKREEAYTVLKLMQKITKEEPKLWGSAIVGFGTYTYKYASGQQGDWPLVAFSPRKQNLTLYIESDFEKRSELMAKLGKYKTSKACLYLKSLKDIDMKVLQEIITRSVDYTKKKHAK
jgi:Domain of unknown function (DU1801)